MKFIPKGQKLIVLLDRVEEKKIGGIYLPDMHSENSRLARVLSIGPEVVDYKPGEMVLINFFAGKVLDVVTISTLIKKQDDTLRVVTEAEVLVGVSGKGDSLDLSVQSAPTCELSIWAKIKLMFKIFFISFNQASISLLVVLSIVTPLYIPLKNNV